LAHVHEGNAPKDVPFQRFETRHQEQLECGTGCIHERAQRRRQVPPRSDCASVLQKNLDAEKATDLKPTQIAERSVNLKAA